MDFNDFKTTRMHRLHHLASRQIRCSPAIGPRGRHPESSLAVSCVELLADSGNCFCCGWWCLFLSFL